MPKRINWYGEAGLFLTDDEVSEVAGTLNVLCDRLDCDDEDQLVVDASALCLRLVQGLTGVLPTLRPTGDGVVIQEWAVADDRGRLLPPYRGPYRTKEEAEAYLRWLLDERRLELEAEAAAEEAAGFPEGNVAYYRWNQPERGERFRTYRLVCRTVTEWRDVEPAGLSSPQFDPAPSGLGCNDPTPTVGPDG